MHLPALSTTVQSDENKAKSYVLTSVPHIRALSPLWYTITHIANIPH